MGDPSYVYEHLEIRREGEREEEAVVSRPMIKSVQLLIVKILSCQKNSKPSACKYIDQYFQYSILSNPTSEQEKVLKYPVGQGSL